MPNFKPFFMLNSCGLLLLGSLLACNRTGNTPKVSPSPTVPSQGSTPGQESIAASSLPSEAQIALRLINQARATGRNCKDDKLDQGFFPAAKPVAWNLKLEAAARNHSRDMRDKNYFAHASPSGVTLQKRLELTGYVWRLIGENIAAGQPTVERAIEGWIGSPSHCAVLMNAGFTQMGLARIEGSGTNTYKVYWTLDFGTPR